jgi:hypothetical protein
MPFLSGPPAPKPDQMGLCTVCGEHGRIWKFCEQEVSLTVGYSALLSYAICRGCLEVVVELLVGEDDDDAGSAGTPPG